MTKRHESLIPLSKDHYHGLLLALQIREEHRTVMKDWPKLPADRALFVARFHSDRLKRHFEAEEQALFPLAVRFIPSSKPIVEHLLRDHRAIESLAKELSNPDPLSTAQNLHGFADILESHIRREERELFSLFEEHSSQEVLAQAATLIGRYYPEQSDHDVKT